MSDTPDGIRIGGPLKTPDLDWGDDEEEYETPDFPHYPDEDTTDSYTYSEWDTTEYD